MSNLAFLASLCMGNQEENRCGCLGGSKLKRATPMKTVAPCWGTLKKEPPHRPCRFFPLVSLSRPNVCTLVPWPEALGLSNRPGLRQHGAGPPLRPQALLHRVGQLLDVGLPEKGGAPDTWLRNQPKAYPSFGSFWVRIPVFVWCVCHPWNLPGET